MNKFLTSISWKEKKGKQHIVILCQNELESLIFDFIL